ncbi:hypothetical protein QBC47DRAFT_5179 [Echria macrotheca]|uniref:Uncharacterized protein n=1 Tax=Echria macrotheca TaxID=438768 RepID=A0AAJ0F9N4_9PEZI|nr:hypothetical protein QBC47DRAFT_5179 [Echria macrotheca]
MPVSRQYQDWNTSICESGEGDDCPRSWFLSCDQYGRTRYRLRQLRDDSDPLDLRGYEKCNGPCWKYGLLCFGGFYIGSGIYTAHQTGRIRATYNIWGNRYGDVAKGIFCQPCSLIQNDLEIRRREREKGVELQLSQGRRGPTPLGEENYRPIFTMPVTEKYRAEPQMTTGSKSGDEMPGYSTEQEVSDSDTIWRNWNGLPQIPHVSSPIAMDRRPKILTPISEGDSLAEERRSQQRRTSPIFPQVQNWLKSTSSSSSPSDTPTGKVSVTAQGHDSSPALTTNGTTHRRTNPRPGPGKILVKPQKIARNDKPPRKETAETPTSPRSGLRAETTTSAPDIRYPDEYRGSTGVQVPSPSESQRHNSLRADILEPSPNVSPPERNRPSGLSDPPSPQRPHDTEDGPRMPGPSSPPLLPHDPGADNIPEVWVLAERSHSLPADAVAPRDATAAGKDNIRSDELASGDTEGWESYTDSGPPGPTLPVDSQVSIPRSVHFSDSQKHPVGSEAVVGAPAPSVGHDNTPTQRAFKLLDTAPTQQPSEEPK